MVLLNTIFVETDTFFMILWEIETSEEQHLFENEIFSNITNVFIVTYDQFNASLLNLKKKIQKNLNANFLTYITSTNDWYVFLCVCFFLYTFLIRF